jgi:hypothetical protein
VRKGKKIDLQNWLIPRALGKSDYADFKPFSAEFRALIMAHWLDDPEESPECKAAASQEESWDMGLDPKGVVFMPWMAHVMTPCIVPVVVPFAKIRPFLNEAGKANMASVQAGLR